MNKKTTESKTAMTLNEYQELAMRTCMETCDNPLYMLFGLQGEVGELAGKIAKLIRKGHLVFNDNQSDFTEKFKKLPVEQIDQTEHDLLSEIGDVAWMLAGTCHALGYNLEDVCRMNLAKLADRKQRGVIDGNGDNR